MGRRPKEGKAKGQVKIVVEPLAYEYLKQSLRDNPKLANTDMKTAVSNLIKTFLNASLKWHEEIECFELHNGRLFVNLETYLRTGWIMREPLIEALLDMADLSTWKKFVEILEKFQREYGERR